MAQSDRPEDRFQINQRCIYERRLPGHAYVTAHIERLQHSHYVSVDGQFQISHSEKPLEKLEKEGWQLPQFL